MRYYVMLKKLKAYHQQLRDDEIRGFCDAVPTEGRPFFVYGEGRDVLGSMRLVSTSPVTSVANIEEDGEVVGYIFNTESGSTYQLDLLLTQRA